jgi:hypothetical protein
MKKYLPLILWVAMLSPVLSLGQSFYSIRHERSLIVSAGAGTSSYFGELKDPGDNFDARPNLALGLQYFVHPNVSVRSELTYFTLKGDDALSEDQSRVNRNLSFTSGNIELNMTGAVHLFPLGRRFYQRKTFNVYGFAGFGLMFMNPKAEYQGQKYALQPLMTEDVKYSKIQPVIPYGIGAKVKMGPFFNLAVEGGWRLTFTDYLDDVSTVHPDKSSWTDPIRVALSDRRVEGNPNLSPYPVGAQRGNADKNDGYFLLNVKVEYYLAKNFLFTNPNRKLYNTRRKAYYR